MIARAANIWIIFCHGLLQQLDQTVSLPVESNSTKCPATKPHPKDCCWCDAVARSDRITEIARVQPQTSAVSLVNIGQWKEILTSPGIDDAKIVIFSMVGETRAGKSTLLNIIYRYLACHQTNKRDKQIPIQDWLYEREEWPGNQHVFPTSSHSGAHTKNIWITREPIILTKSRGSIRSKVAVFLMDSQGLFDLQGKSAVDSQLFYLTSLLSSTLVVNKMRRLDGLLLKQVAAYTLQMATSIMSTEMAPAKHRKFLQDLVFLVRDAQFLDPYGWAAGQTVLHSAFPRGSDGVLAEMETVYQQISCFLLPPIAADTRNLRILPSRLTSEFGGQLQVFLDKVFSSKTIRPKVFYGRHITAREYAKHIELIESFTKNDSFPSVQDVHEGLMVRTGHRVSEEACRKYRHNMDQSVLQSLEILSNESLNHYHQVFLEQAKGHLRANHLLSLNGQAASRALENAAACVESMRQDYVTKLLLRKEAEKLKKQNEETLEVSRRLAVELDQTRNTVQQQSSILAQENSWTEAITRPVKWIVSCVIAFMALCVLYAGISCAGQRCFKLK